MATWRTRTRRRGWAPLALLLVLAACATSRPPAVPPELDLPLPWGAIPIGDPEWRDQLFENTMVRRLTYLREKNPGSQIPYPLLSLSGGGARGAFGAGVLRGWTESGNRPLFEIVTGISTGALMATHAFLGSEFDDQLMVYTDVGNEEIFDTRSLLSLVRTDSLLDTYPLRSILESSIDEETLDLVAEEHRKGRRLLVGTTNLDANAFMVWSLSAIAASDRPDRVERYIDVVLASASFPVAFPPVYIPVETPEGTRYQMHVDGSTRESVFVPDFNADFDRAAARLELGKKDVSFDLYLINNGHLYAETDSEPVEASMLGIAGATVASLMRQAALGSIYQLWVRALIHGARFNVAFIPSEYPLPRSPLDFDPELMGPLFQFGYEQAVTGDVWMTTDAPDSKEELIQQIDPALSVRQLEFRPWASEAPHP